MSEENREATLYFKEGMLDENPSMVFVKALKNMKEGKIEEAKKQGEKIIDNFDFLVEKALKNGISGLNMSKLSLMNLVIKLILEMDCKECFYRVLSRVYESLEVSIALMRNLKDKKLVEWLREYIRENPGEGMHLLKDMGKEEIKLFFEEVYRIAKDEVELPQYLALEMLSEFEEDKVLSLFKNFATDWDKRVRRIAIKNLVKRKNKEGVKEVLEDALEDEKEEDIKFIIKSALNREEGKNEE